MKKFFVCTLILVVVACEDVDEPTVNYPLLSLFDVNQSLDGQEVKVTGYFGYWDGDIPVLYATFSDYQKADGLYKSHLIFSHQDNVKKAIKEDEGKICTFKAKVWYEYAAPTFDNAVLVSCIDGVR